MNFVEMQVGFRAIAPIGGAGVGSVKAYHWLPPSGFLPVDRPS